MLNAGLVQAFANLNTDGFVRGMRTLKKQGDEFAKTMGPKFTQVGKTLTTSLTLPLGLAGGAMIKLASDAEETSAKFNTVFSSINADAQKSAKVLTDSFGLSKKASEELLGNTGDLLTGFGFTQSAALDLSTEVNKLAVDLASFTNFSGGAEGASAALTKALLGERESVKSLGISILEADVNAKMLVNTQKGLTFESERQAKAFATLQLAQEQSKNAIGDFSRTQNSFANQSRQLKAELEDLAVVFGNKLLPLATRLVGSARGMIESFSGLTDASKKFTVALGGIAFLAGPTLLFLGSLAKAYLSLQLALPKLIIAVKSLNLAMLANPYVAVGVAVAALAIKFNNARVEANKLKKEIQDVANLEFKVSSLQAVNDTIDKVSEKIEKIKKTGKDRVGLIGGNTAGEIKELKSLGQQLDILKQQRSNIVFGGFANELEAESKQANDLSQSVNRVSESISHLRTKTDKPVDIIIGGNWTDLFDIAKNAEMDLNLPEKIAPQGSMARLQQDLAKLQESLAFTADPEKFKSLQTQIETLEKRLHGMTAIPDKIAPEGSMAKLKQDLAALQLQLEFTADPVKFALLNEEIEDLQIKLGLLQGDAVKGTNSMAGLANSIGSIFERAALQGENLSQVLKGIIKQLAARAFVTGIGILLTGGVKEGSTFLKTMFGGMFHSGGVVQGSGDRMIRAKGGEMVLTKSQQKALSMGMTAPSGGGMSQGQIERAFSNALSRHIRGVSDRQIFEMSEKGRYN